MNRPAQHEMGKSCAELPTMSPLWSIAAAHYPSLLASTFAFAVNLLRRWILSTSFEDLGFLQTISFEESSRISLSVAELKCRTDEEPLVTRQLRVMS